MVDEVQIGTQPTQFGIIDSVEGRKEGQHAIQFIEIPDWGQLNPSASLSLSIRYKGKIHDPPRSSKDLAFVRPDKTLGHIGPEGLYLTSETAWYPDLPETLSTFKRSGNTPRGMDVRHSRTTRLSSFRSRDGDLDMGSHHPE